MVNDITTLNGSLSQLGETLASNITSKGVSASANDGLTTLANKVLEIGSGGTTIIEDKGTTTSHNDIWTISNATLTRGANYTTISETTEPAMVNLNSAYITPTSTVELDICLTDGSKTYAPIYIRNSGGGSSLCYFAYNDLDAELGDWVHIRIVFNNTSTITIYASTLSEPITKTLSSTDTAYRILFYGGGTRTEILLKNFRVFENSDCSQYQTQIEDAITYINGSGN